MLAQGFQKAMIKIWFPSEKLNQFNLLGDSIRRFRTGKEVFRMKTLYTFTLGVRKLFSFLVKIGWSFLFAYLGHSSHFCVRVRNCKTVSISI
jgi:hypothetical protein